MYKKLLEDPQTQIVFHRRMMRFWVWAASVLNLVYFYSLYLLAHGHVIEAAGIAGFIAYITNQISFYANWVSDFDGLSAAQSTLETIKQNRGQDHPRVG